jgi:hypothetical protein
MHAVEFEAALEGQPCHFLGEVDTTDRLTIRGAAGHTWVDANLDDLKAAWQATLKDL